jgi:hypothetical protein
MPETQAQRERLQFPLRALFVFTAAAALLATLARWLIRQENAWPLLFATSIGLVVGFVTVVILQNAQITSLLVVLLIGFAVCGLWFSGGFVCYGIGFVIGAIVAVSGLSILNGVFRICGLTVSIVERPTGSVSIDE